MLVLMVVPSARSSSITLKSPRSSLFVTARMAFRRTGNFSPSRLEMPVKKVKMSIASDSESFGFSCPVDFEEIRERLGVQSEEEIEIEDYELPFPLEGNTRLWEINALCRMVQEMQGTPLYYEMDVVQKRWFPSFTEFIDHKDQIRCYPVQDGESLARYLVQEVQLFGEVHPDLLNHIDYAAIGRELETSENYLFTDNGIFYYR
jgi:hypothetical protein